MIYTLCSSIDRKDLILNIDKSSTKCIEKQITSEDELNEFLMPLIEALDSVKNVA